ncbi:hypothetical protein [Nocardioides sp. WS12]|uniref:hypothetical protein n=1 Tax=Nocardioides sp. WS12 TaxID=2486272 RepID=UPI0015F89B53|nr:hypothetical protein [Nocardioides sp. WS12]
MAGLDPSDRRGPAARFLGLPAALAVLALLCGGCSDDPDESDADPSAPVTDITVECDRFEDTAQRITDAQTALYDGKDSPADAEAVDTLVAELDALKDDAPDDVDTALTDLGEGFRSAQELLADPSAADGAALAELAPGLSEDSQTVTTWILSQCD